MNDMKKLYIKPTTIITQMHSGNTIMLSSGGGSGFTDPDIGWGTGGYDGSGQ